MLGKVRGLLKVLKSGKVVYRSILMKIIIDIRQVISVQNLLGRRHSLLFEMFTSKPTKSI